MVSNKRSTSRGTPHEYRQDANRTQYSEREYIEEVVGAPAIKSTFLNSKSNLLVFELNDKPVKAAGISPDFLRPEDHRVTFPANADLKPAGGGILMLTVPASQQHMRGFQL